MITPGTIDRPRWTGPLAAVLALALAAASPASAAPTSDTSEASEASEASPDPVADPMPEVTNFFREGELQRKQGHHVQAADLFVAAYERLDDPRRYRNARGTAMSKIYDSLLAAYEAAETDEAKVRHACRLRNLLVDYVDTLGEGYGAASEGFPEVRFGREKLAGLDLTIASYGPPDQLCKVAPSGSAAGGPRRTVPLLSHDSTPPETGPTPTRGGDVVVGPPQPDLEAERERRRARGMRAGGAIVLSGGAILLGTMTAYLVRGAQMSFEAERIDAALTAEMRAPTAEESAWREWARTEGPRSNTIAMATGISGGALVVAGTILTAIASKRLRSQQMSVAPQAGPHSAGLQLQLRF